MDKIKEFTESLNYFIDNDVCVFDEALKTIYSIGFTKTEIEMTKRELKKRAKYNKEFYNINKNLSCKVSTITISEDNYIFCMKIPPFSDVNTTDPFLSKTGNLFEILNADVVIMKDYKVIYRNERIREYLGIDIATMNEPFEKFQTEESYKEFLKFLKLKRNGEIFVDIVSSKGKIDKIKTGVSYLKYSGHDYHISIVKDISTVQDIEKRFIDEIDYMQHAIQSINEAIIVVNSQNKITLFNHAATTISGILNNAAIDKDINEIIIILDEDKNRINYLNESKFQNKNAYIYREDGMFWNISISIEDFFNDKKEYLGKVLTIIDISEIKRRENEILYLSYHDMLTGLYNRTFLEETIKRLDTPRKLPFSVIMGDVNGLKITNDVFGHDQGDSLLRNVSKILKQVCRTEDIIGRWGGDEFVVLLPETNNDEVFVITKRIIRAFEDLDDSYRVQGILPSISLGYGIKKSESEDIFEALKEAETNMYKRKMLSKESMYSGIISSMKSALYEKSHETQEHTSRLYNSCASVAKIYNFTQDELSDLELLCMLHDVGKIGVSDSILKHPGKLNEHQWEEMKKHPEIGFRIAQTTPELKKVSDYILYHHEHFDGSGYPEGLVGYEIPLIDRILGVADAFDAMTNDRVYQKAMSKEDAYTELENNSGSQFDPEVVKLFIKEHKKK